MDPCSIEKMRELTTRADRILEMIQSKTNYSQAEEESACSDWDKIWYWFWQFKNLLFGQIDDIAPVFREFPFEQIDAVPPAVHGLLVKLVRVHLICDMMGVVGRTALKSWKRNG
jgi:hypothetical protein